jgi:peptide/nickel transport system substrate-binding protein
MNYWSEIISRRVNRRRALASSAVGVAGAALLAACGGDDGPGESNSSGLVAKPVDTIKQAQRGGIMLSLRDREVDTSDPYMRSRTQPGTALTYSRLFRQKPGYLSAPPAEFIGDLADTWEFSPDKRQLTIKLKPNARWHNRAPVNARPVDAQDVVYSWERFSKVGVNRALLVNSVSPVAPIDSITALDNRTVSLKLAKPTAALIPLLSGAISGYFWMLPRESESQYDLRRVNIGSGPWMVHDYQTSIHLIFKRHEGWHSADQVYFDEVREPIVAEYASGLAQFKTGAMYRFGVRPQDILATKKDAPALNLFLLDPESSGDMAFFGWNPVYGAATPFRDKRLRQALSLSFERDLWIDTFYNVEKFRAAGLPVEPSWNTVRKGLRPQRQVLPVRLTRSKEAGQRRWLPKRHRR